MSDIASPYIMMSPDKDDRVKTVTETGKAVKRRISSIETARSLEERTLDEFRDRQYRNARLQAQRDGAPPLDEDRLTELGLGYLVNVNFLEMNSILNQKAASWYELFYEVPTVTTFTPIPGLEKDYFEYAKVLDREFHRTMMDWSGFLPLMDKARREADLFGIGVAVWPDAWDWRARPFSSGAYYFDSRAKIDYSTHDYFILKDEDTTAGELYRSVFANPELAAAEGWNLEAVKKLLIAIFYDQVQQDDEGKMTSTSLWEDLQERLRTGNWTDEVKEFDRVKLTHLYVREMESGKYSQYIYSEMRLQVDDKTPDDFLFKSEDAVDRPENVVWILPYDCGDGYLKSVRGLASYIETHCDLSNRYLCRVYDAGFLAASVIMQPKTAGDYSNAQVIKSGVQTILPPESNFNVIQKSTMVGDVASLIPLRSLSISIMQNNTGVLRQRPEIPAEQQVQKTARQVAEESAREARLEKSAIQFDYGYLEKFYRETFRRLTNPQYIKSRVERPGQKEARQFVERVMRGGVPPEVALDLSRFFILNVTRAVGLGSWGLRLDITNQIVGMSQLSDFGEEGRRNAVRDRVATLVGYNNVDRYVPPVNSDLVPKDESSHAVLENNDLQEGSQVLAASDQWHVTHLLVHAPPVIQILKAVEENQVQDPRKMLQVLVVSVQHLGDHYQYLAKDPLRQQYAEQTKMIIDKAMPAIQTLGALVKRQMEVERKLAEKQGQLMDDARNALQQREQELKELEIRGKIEADLMVKQSLNEQRELKANEQAAIRRRESDAKIADMHEVTAAKIAIDQQKAAAKEANR